MNAHYDDIAGQYAAYANASPTRVVELRAMLHMAGELEGRSVLDLACGFGFYGRAMLRAGAASAHGVDQSPEMVAIGRQMSAHAGDAMTFQVSDFLQLAPVREYDVAVAAFLFNYAQSLDELARMAKAAFQHVRAGGRIAVETMNPQYCLAEGDCSKHGLRVLDDVPWKEGAKMEIEFPGAPPARITVFRWAREHYERAFAEAGFTELVWQAPCLLEQDRLAQPAGYWDDLLRNGLAAWFSCTRP